MSMLDNEKFKKGSFFIQKNGVLRRITSKILFDENGEKYIMADVYDKEHRKWCQSPLEYYLREETMQKMIIV